MNDDLAAEHAQAILTTLGPTGRLLGMSKTGYRDAHPDHAVVFNANVCLAGTKIWFGDIDLTTDEPLLADLAARTGQVVHLLYERDARFRNEDQPQLDEAIYSITPTGHTSLDHTRLERRVDGQIHERQYPRPPRWRTPGRPRLWRLWCVQASTKREETRLGYHRSHRLCIGERGHNQRSPLLVFALDTFTHEARGGCIELNWNPGARRAWAPTIATRWKWHGTRIRPSLSVRLAPGVGYTLRVELITGPRDPIWG